MPARLPKASEMAAETWPNLVAMFFFEPLLFSVYFSCYFEIQLACAFFQRTLFLT